jgi:hypothetical protein
LATDDLNGQVAQLVEQRIENPRVGGSIPPLATKQFKASRRVSRLGAFLQFGLLFYKNGKNRSG